MRLLADENFLGAVVEWLRSGGHDVVYAAEVLAQEPDVDILALAADERRVVLTDDKDFGDLVFRDHRITAGVILFRLHGLSPATRVARIAAVWDELERSAVGQFTTVDHARLRFRSSDPA